MSIYRQVLKSFLKFLANGPDLNPITSPLAYTLVLALIASHFLLLPSLLRFPSPSLLPPGFST